MSSLYHHSRVIDVQNVHWTRNGTDILHDITWTVAEGQHWALLGLNGSGKTTLLNIVTGYVWPTQGHVSVLGHRYGTVDLRQLRTRIGWVSSSFQEKIHPRESGLNVVISGLHASIGLYEKPKAEHVERALHLMESLGCHATARQPYATCSHGEKQKLLIARALMAEPDLLILDEPCTGLDFVSRESLLHTIAGLARQPDGPTLLYVTHHVEEILPELTHTLLLRQGTIVAQGRTKDVLHGATLSEAFCTPVDVQRHGNRRWLIPKDVTSRNT